MKNPLTASERRGILVVAGIALVITAAGWIVSLCNRPVPEEPLPEVEVLVAGDSVMMRDSVGNVGKTKRKRKSRKDTVGNSKGSNHKQYRRRSPLDEKV